MSHNRSRHRFRHYVLLRPLLHKLSTCFVCDPTSALSYVATEQGCIKGHNKSLLVGGSIIVCEANLSYCCLKWKSRNIAYSIFRSNRISRVLNTQNFHFRLQQVMLTYSIVKILLDLKSDSLSSLVPGMSILLSLQREWLYPVVGCGAFKGILQKLCRPRVSSSPHEIYAPWSRPARVVLSYCWGFPSWDWVLLFCWSAGDSLA